MVLSNRPPLFPHDFRKRAVLQYFQKCCSEFFRIVRRKAERRDLAGLRGEHAVGVVDLPIAAALAAQERVAKDGEQPGAAVGAWIESIERPERAQIRLLDDVLGLGPVAGQPQRSSIERVQMDERRTLERGRLGLGSMPGAQVTSSRYER